MRKPVGTIYFQDGRGSYPSTSPDYLASSSKLEAEKFGELKLPF